MPRGLRGGGGMGGFGIDWYITHTQRACINMTAKEVFNVSCHDFLKIGSKMSEKDVKNRAEQGRKEGIYYIYIMMFINLF